MSSYLQSAENYYPRLKDWNFCLYVPCIYVKKNVSYLWDISSDATFAHCSIHSTAVQIYLGIHIFLQDQSLVYLAVGVVDPLLLNFVWAHNYMPDIEKNVKKETNFNFKLQRSSEDKNVVK